MSEADLATASVAAQSWVHGRIVDADSHIDPPYDIWQEYLPANLRDRAPRLEHADDGDYVVFQGNRRPLPMLSNTIGRKFSEFSPTGKVVDQHPAWDASTRLADMDRDGMDTAILFGGGPIGTTDNELFLASYVSYSNWVMDFCSAAPKRLVPVGYLPVREVDEAVAHVRRLGKMGFRAVQLPAFPQNAEAWKTSTAAGNRKEAEVAAQSGDPEGPLQYWQPEFDKLWAALCDEDIAIAIHLGARSPRFSDKRFFLPDMPMGKLAMAEPIGVMIFNAIFQRFPKLRLGTIESGVGWFHWLAEYMDRTWEKQRFWTESPLTERPSFYMEQNVWGSFINDRGGVLCRELPSAKNIMWSSDYPHSETTFPNSHAVIMRDCEGVPADDVRDIICNNARRFYGID